MMRCLEFCVFYNRMTDINLNDQIKKDKANRAQKRSKLPPKGRKGRSQPGNAPINKARPQSRLSKANIGKKFSSNINNIKRKTKFINKKNFRNNFNQHQNRKQDQIKYQNKKIQQSHQQASQKQPNMDKLEPNREKGRTLKVIGLHPDFSNNELRDLFAPHGTLEKCHIEYDDFGRSQTTAIVKYLTAESALKAMGAANQQKVMNSIITVEPYKSNRK